MEQVWPQSRPTYKLINSYLKVPHLEVHTGTAVWKRRAYSSERRTVRFGKGRLETQVKLCAGRLLHFVVTAPSKEVVEHYVLPQLKHFLSQRGLALNEAKTRIVHRTEGFDFLGFNIRRYNDILLIKPQKQKVQAHLRNLKHSLLSHRQATVAHLVQTLNPIITGWANYYRHVNAKETFTYVEYRLWHLLWNWAKRRHPTKPAKWVKQHYFKPLGRRQMVFGNADVTLRNPAAIPIIRYVKVIGRYSPYNPALKDYWTKRYRHQVQQQANSRLKQRVLQQQDYQCGQCRLPFLPQDLIHFHHIIPHNQGGSDGPHNRLALHAYCHHQFHQRVGYAVLKA